MSDTQTQATPEEQWHFSLTAFYKYYNGDNGRDQCSCAGCCELCINLLYFNSNINAVSLESTLFYKENWAFSANTCPALQLVVSTDRPDSQSSPLCVLQ